jgi:hypothetical protein
VAAGPESEPLAAEQRGRVRRRGGGWAWVIVALALGALKARALTDLMHHRVELIAVLALGMIVSVLRPRPVAFAAFAAPIAALAVAPRSAAAGAATGLGTFVFLTALFFALGSLLQARDGRRL